MKLLTNLTPSRISRLLFLLIVFFLPQQFGPHFWPSFAFVDGVRLDYLSPTIYATDILILVLSFFSLKPTLNSNQTKKLFSNKLFLIFLVTILIPLFYAKSPQAILNSYIKFSELLFLGLYTATQLKRRDLVPVFSTFCVSMTLESILGLTQFIFQGSANGMWYFLGERYFTPNSIGQAVVDLGSGVLVRPYATFPHPNIFAFYLLTASVFSTYISHASEKKSLRLTFLMLFVLFQIILFFTLSRVVILLDCVFLFYAYFFLPLKENRKKRKTWLLLLTLPLFILLLYSFYFSQRFFNFQILSTSIIPRVDLLVVSLKIISQNFFFGVGLHNFYFHEVLFQKDLTGTYLQPVHNIFLLIASETGIVGLLTFVYFTISTGKRLIKNFSSFYSFNERMVLIILFISWIIQGIFDHYFLTTQQGLLLTTVIFSLSYTERLYLKK